MALVLLLGGARSGKSAMAVRLASDSQASVTFIATASAGDEEMAERIRRHREARAVDWKTVEAPIDVLGPIGTTAAGDFIVIDCLTLWVANLLGQGAGAFEISSAASEIVGALRARDCVVVTNEVGLGIVPVNELARRFRDALGDVNALFAAAADRAVLMVAGRAIDLASIESVLGR
jgi:adenosyl cobinamide kinase/adenosyl cobinamide phosphate guanylyltransferase